MALGPELYSEYKTAIFYGSLILVGLGGIMFLWAWFHPKEEQTAKNSDFSIKTGDISDVGNRVGHDIQAPVSAEQKRRTH